MNQLFKIIEFDKIIQKLASYTDSKRVKDRISDLKMLDIDKAKMAQRQTTEAVFAMLRQGNPPVGLSVPDIESCIKRVEAGSLFNAKELLNISRVLYVSRSIKSYIKECGDDLEILRNLSDCLETAKHLEDKINSIILSEDEIADDASSELLSLRRKQKNLNSKIRENLNSMIHSEYYKKFLQDNIVTVRGDRFVIPVKSEYRHEVNGIVHDTSSSGSTLFIEPMNVVSANNEIRELKIKEEREIEKILAQLTSEVSEYFDMILQNFKVLCDIDFIFCKGKLSLDYDAREPELNDDGIIEFIKARHPLIDKDKVVANDIYMGKDFDTLVITGPNTGGKTVTLKTIGLFSVMAAAGLHIPAADSSKAAVFSKIFADIGDEQSIEQSLSTFSSHMVNIVNICEQIDDNSLALFDELGAGTDPTEGAALAISILEYFKTFRVKTVATTHYSELKLYALSTDRVENASCEFNVETLNPTYRLMIGIPGKSNAFAISRRLGLNDSIIARANTLLSDENIKFEDVISDLEISRATAKSEMDYAKKMKKEIQDLRAELEKDRRRLKENKSRILDEARQEAKIIVMEARDEANAVIRELEKIKNNPSEKSINDKISKSRQRLKKKEDSLDKAMAKSAIPTKTFQEPPKNLKPGDTVQIITMDDQEASVLKLPDKNGMVLVQAGILKMDIHISNLKKTQDKNSKQLADKYIKSDRVFQSKTKEASTSVDVRGQVLEEALMNVEKFIDDCYLAGISPATIIHGRGTGVLKKGIHEMLKKNKRIKSYRLGTFGEGQDGVTIAEIK